MRKKKVVKEGSPFEEEYLLELLKEETKLHPDDKEQVKRLMLALYYFSFIQESTLLHSLVEKVIISSYEVASLYSVEQQKTLESNQQMREVFDDVFGKEKRGDLLKKELVEWENHKCYKH